jgi:hypothetical protein
VSIFLKFPDSTGVATNNKCLVEVSGITGNLTNVTYTLAKDMPVYSLNRYILDGRRTAGSIADSGGTALYLLQFGATNINTTGFSSIQINGSSSPGLNAFNNAKEGDVVSLSMNASVGSGAFAFGARFNEVEHAYGMAIGSMSVTDGAGVHEFSFDSVTGNQTVLQSTDGALTMTLYNFPVDGSQWVSEIGTSPPTGLAGTLGNNGVATMGWDSYPSATGYYIEFRRRLS